MSEKSGVYQIRCRPTGKLYIGSSKSIYSRWKGHRTLLNKDRNPCRGLQNAWNKYGEAAFQFSILEECVIGDLEQTEQRYIDTLRPALNILTDAKRRYGPEMLARRAAALRARAALITYCPRGHLYDDKNTYVNARGKRICRACNAIRVSRVYASETPEQRELRRKRVAESHQNNRASRHAKQRAYNAIHKTEKAAYDKARRSRWKMARGS